MSLNIPDFSLFFAEKLQPLLEKAPFFENLVGGSAPPVEGGEGGGGAHYDIYYDIWKRAEILMQILTWRLAPLQDKNVQSSLRFKYDYVGFFSLTKYFWPVNYVERVISSIFTMKAETHKKWEILPEDYFNGREVV